LRHFEVTPDVNDSAPLPFVKLELDNTGVDSQLACLNHYFLGLREGRLWKVPNYKPYLSLWPKGINYHIVSHGILHFGIVTKQD